MMNKIFISSTYGYQKRETVLEIGKEYVVQPLNRLKKKHRDRHCVILDFVPVSDFRPMDLVAKVRFLDNNRIGRTDLGDLAKPHGWYPKTLHLMWWHVLGTDMVASIRKSCFVE